MSSRAPVYQLPYTYIPDTVAVARRDGVWKPSGKINSVTFEPVPRDQRPNLSDEMGVGCVHKIVDWREFDPDILFKCSKCSEDMLVATHLPEPDGVRRDQLSCTASRKSLGLAREEGAARPTTPRPRRRATSGRSSGCASSGEPHPPD
mgnify:CR=1 FL=1